MPCRAAGENVPSHAAGPTRCGSSAGAREIRQVYATKMPTSTTESISVIECFSGRVSEYAVATARYASSTEWLRSRRTPSHRAGGRPARRRCSAPGTRR